MPDRFDDIIPQPVPIQKITMDGLQRLILGLMVLLLAVVTGLLLVVGSLMTNINTLESDITTIRDNQKEIEANQGEGEIRGHKIRAVSCEMLAYLIATEALPEVCLEPAVLEFYDPEKPLPEGEGDS